MKKRCNLWNFALEIKENVNRRVVPKEDGMIKILLGWKLSDTLTCVRETQNRKDNRRGEEREEMFNNMLVSTKMNFTVITCNKL